MQNFSKCRKDASPIVIRERFAEYEELVGITFDKIVSLTALGLIETDLAAVSAGYKMEIDPLPNKIIYYDMEKELKDKRDLQVGNVLFTKAGQALYWAIDAEKVEGFWENYCIPFGKIAVMRWQGKLMQVTYIGLSEYFERCIPQAKEKGICLLYP